MEVVPFKSEHFYAIEPQVAQNYVRELVSKAHVKALEQGGSFTCMHEGKPVCCHGWMEVFPHRAIAWAYLDKSAGKHLAKITRIGRAMMEGLKYNRIEMEVDCEFEAGHRWAKMLGFQKEVDRMVGYRLDGGDSSIYTRMQ